MSENLLKYETSPYLRQHADNPVHWRPWGQAALDEARRTSRPILLSVGYAACHWCHVMAHESFEDAGVASVMNELFVNIKVDREERPDVDQLYMNALHLLGEQGGWPLTMFLTPDGDAVWGGTYFPKTARYGRPGFVEVMREFARLYREEPTRIEHNRAAISARLSVVPESVGAELRPELIVATAGQLLQAIDPVNGGLRGAPKFPQAPLLDLLRHAGHRTGHDVFFRAVDQTLVRMSRGGIYDHVGGGYARYAVDERWLVPHFEKMLYDNALIIDLLTEAWLRTGNDLFRTRIVETVDWLRREMATDAGAFAASLDADSEGEEGLYYTWTPEELAAVLGDDDAQRFALAYDFTEGGNFEGRSIPNRLADPFPLPDAEETHLSTLRRRLLEARSGRIPPGLDDKVLADWNGLTIAALSKAATALARSDWLDMARQAYRFVRESMSESSRLAHSRLRGKSVFPGLSSDYAAMIGAALALHASTGEAAYLDDAVAWVETLDQWHRDSRSGAYFLAASDAADIRIRLRQGSDDPVPNPNALIAEGLVRLWRLTGEDRYRERADDLFDAYAGEIAASPLAHAGLLAALDMRLATMQIVVVGEDGDAARADLAAAARLVPDPNRLVLEIAPGATLPESHPAHEKGTVGGRAAAYVCVGEVCSLPVTDPGRLRTITRHAVAKG